VLSKFEAEINTTFLVPRIRAMPHRQFSSKLGDFFVLAQLDLL
jgi:hypothetical protein